MPTLPLRPCLNPACPALVRRGRCPACESERKKGLASLPTRETPTQRGYGYPWVVLRRAQLKREPLCRICGEPATDVDHIRRRTAGGSEDGSNLQSLCHAHHSQKTAKEMQLWQTPRR
jgi:5-methylcytosine-specific restriction protein A